MSDNNQGESYGYICRGCKTDDDGNPVDKKRKTKSEGSAKILKSIHETKTGHKAELL